MRLGDKVDEFVADTMLRSQGGTFWFLDAKTGVLWHKENLEPAAAGPFDSHGWRTQVVSGVFGVPPEVMATLRPFTVVGFPQDDSPEELFRCESEFLASNNKPTAIAT